MHNLETDRLKFRKWTEEDFPEFSRYFGISENTRFLGGMKTPEESWRLMVAYLGHYELKGFGYLAVMEKSTGQLVGCVGLWDSEPWPETELGYWILENMQGKGYAYEAAKAVKEYAFRQLNLRTLVSYIDPENQPSIRLAEKLGGVFDEEIELLTFGKHRVYRYS